MTSSRNGLVLRDVDLLMEGRSVAALGTSQLLDRFAIDRDEAAFEALMTRHGPMVLGTCRRMLADPDDVDDAFQATFLVLARRAGSIQDADRLGPWLHGVARRVATRSRALATRRKARERASLDEPAVEAPDALESFELRSAIDDELSRLPEKYRAPLVLCYLEGLTHDEAARQLRWPVGTVRSRLAGGRDRLRSRLTRRGLAPSAAIPGLLSHVLMPRTLLFTTLRVATSAGSVPAHVATLAKGALIAMIWNKLKLIAAIGLMASLTVGGAGVAAQQGGESQAKTPVEEMPTSFEKIQKEQNRIADETSRILRKREQIQFELFQEIRDSERKLRELDSRYDLLADRWKELAKNADPENASNRMAQLEKELAQHRTNMLSRKERSYQWIRIQDEQVEKHTKERSKQWDRFHEELVEKYMKVAESAPGTKDDRPRNETTSKGKMEPKREDGTGLVAKPSATTPPEVDPPASEQTVMTLPRDRLGNPMLLAVISAERDRVTIINSETQKRATFRMPGKVTELVPIIGDNVVALMVKGQDLTRTAIFDRPSGLWIEHDLGQPATSVSPSIGGGFGGGSSGVLIGFVIRAPEFRRLVVFDASKGTWPEQDLREPAKDIIRPVVSGTMVTYSMGRFIYIYSVPAQKWSVLELKHEMSTRTGFGGGFGSPTFDNSGRMVISEGELIHLYDPKTGAWSHIDTKDEK